MTEEKVDRRQFNTGRPPLADVALVKYSFKMTPDQKAKLLRLGGANWLRDRIERAKDADNGR
jgi:hypothetical protein